MKPTPTSLTGMSEMLMFQGLTPPQRDLVSEVARVREVEAGEVEREPGEVQGWGAG